VETPKCKTIFLILKDGPSSMTCICHFLDVPVLVSFTVAEFTHIVLLYAEALANSHKRQIICTWHYFQTTKFLNPLHLRRLFGYVIMRHLVLRLKMLVKSEILFEENTLLLTTSLYPRLCPQISECFKIMFLLSCIVINAVISI
jgi:hypothetical protein